MQQHFHITYKLIWISSSYYMLKLKTLKDTQQSTCFGSKNEVSDRYHQLCCFFSVNTTQFRSSVINTGNSRWIMYNKFLIVETCKRNYFQGRAEDIAVLSWFNLWVHLDFLFCNEHILHWYRITLYQCITELCSLMRCMCVLCVLCVFKDLHLWL